MGATRNAPLQLLLPAIPVAARTARLHLRSWLQRERWPDEPSDDISYGVSEAVTNAVEHAYPPGVDGATVTVTAEVELLPTGMRRVRVRVSDRGRWRPIPQVPCGRGRGFTLMKGLMDRVVITRGDGTTAGTEVVLVSPPVAP
ncbi:ATP-binding protein [Pseudonocardia adelaidensis]|uniref:ATP-binding protein n=1 Tax=Pseudonocardia adelaidensis TaxID=648754 RepID=UPI0031EBBD56